MKRNLFGLIVLLVVILIALLCSCNTPKYEETTTISSNSLTLLNDSIIRSSAVNYAETLVKDGYSVQWAYHKAFVEYAIIPIDSLYYAIEED